MSPKAEAEASPRVAYVISTRGIGGAERFLGALVKEGGARGWEQVVVNPFAGDAAGDLAELFRPARYIALPCPTRRAVPGLWRRVRGEIDAFRPDVVHAMLWHATVLVATMPRRRDQRRVVTNMYGEAIQRSSAAGRGPWSIRARTTLDRWGGKRFDLVIAISAAVERFLVTEYGYAPSKVRAIPLGWEGEPLPPRPDPCPTIVCVALFRPEKGHHVLLDAFVLVRRELPDARLLLVGSGELMGELQDRVRNLGLEGSVEITGPVPEVWPELARGHVFALASTTEAFGIAIVEAMAAGLPVVASDVGGIPELVEVGVTGELFPPGDSAALAAHLIRILAAPDLRSRMSDAARAAAAGRRLSVTVPRYFEACEELIGTDT